MVLSSSGILEWPFWTKLVVVAIGFTGGLVFMYVQCKVYIHLWKRLKAYNRVIYVQNRPDTCKKLALEKPPLMEPSLECKEALAPTQSDTNSSQYTETEEYSMEVLHVWHKVHFIGPHSLLLAVEGRRIVWRSTFPLPLKVDFDPLSSPDYTCTLHPHWPFLSQDRSSINFTKGLELDTIHALFTFQFRWADQRCKDSLKPQLWCIVFAVVRIKFLPPVSVGSVQRHTWDLWNVRILPSLHCPGNALKHFFLNLCNTSSPTFYFSSLFYFRMTYIMCFVHREEHRETFFLNCTYSNRLWWQKKKKSGWVKGGKLAEGNKWLTPDSSAPNIWTFWRLWECNLF